MECKCLIITGAIIFPLYSKIDIMLVLFVWVVSMWVDGFHDFHCPLYSVRESAFNMKDGHQLGEWAESVGLDMYRGLIETHVPSGERLVAMTKQHDLVVSLIARD